MKTRILVFSLLLALALVLPGTVLADDYSHVRIVRLSLVQGDVRFSRPAGDNGAEGQNPAWETAVANLPIREGYVLVTGDGRAAVEFENGAAAYLAENSTLEFTQMGLSDGALITHLKLDQGTATFYAHPGHADEFMVQAPNLSVSLGDKGSFRLDVTGDGSWVSVLNGHAQVASEAGPQEVDKGQMLVLHTGEASTSIASVPSGDDFDKWVAGREETVRTATTTALQYANSPAYTAGFADLSMYGAWSPYAGFGSCWQPYGAGLGWAPFSSGIWMYDASFGGWNWVSSEPWGWLPYHFGGWLYGGNGWCWAPSGFGWTGIAPWQPLTGVWVNCPGRGRHPPIGIVPVHPLDRPGLAPRNAGKGIIVLGSRRTGGPVGTTVHRFDPGDNPQVISAPPRNFLREGLSPAPAPPASRTFVSTGSGNVRPTSGAPSANPGPGIVYDQREHKYVNADAASGAAANAPAGNPAGTMPPTASGPASQTGRESRPVLVAPARPVHVQNGAPSSTATQRPSTSSTPSPSPSRTSPSTSAPRGSGRSGAGASSGRSSSGSSGAGASSGRSSGGGGGGSSSGRSTGGGGSTSGGGGGGSSSGHSSGGGGGRPR